MARKRNPIVTICNDLITGTDYTFDHIVNVGISYGFTQDEVMKALFSEITKKNPGIFLGFNKTAFLNPKCKVGSKAIKIKEPIEKEISKVVIKENKEYIQKWIETEFEKKLEETVQKFVVSEFEKEILPVLIKHIDEKIENIQKSQDKSVKASVAEILSDVVLKLTHQEISSNED